jgi:hypothetical protein
MFVGQWMMDFHEGVMEEITQGNFNRLPEVCIEIFYIEYLINILLK